MSTVEILPFATGTGANVEPQESYATDPSTENGFSAGLASSAKFNKAMRQSSFIAAALATWVSAQSGQDVLDDGDLAGLVTKIGTAITEFLHDGASVIASTNGAVTIPGGIILQWGQYSGTTDSIATNGIYETADLTVTWPEAYPTACFGALAGAYDVPVFGTSEQGWFYPNPGTTTGTARLACRVASQAMTGWFISIGK